MTDSKKNVFTKEWGYDILQSYHDQASDHSLKSTFEKAAS